MSSSRRQRALGPSEQPPNSGSALTQFRGRKTLTIKPPPPESAGSGSAISPRALALTSKVSSHNRSPALRPSSNHHSKTSFFSRSYDSQSQSQSSPRLQRTSPSPDPTTHRTSTTRSTMARVDIDRNINRERSTSIGSGSGSSSDASSKMWDELDQLKSRIRNLERNSRLPSSASAGTGGAGGAGGIAAAAAASNNSGSGTGERPRTATTTTLTTMSATSPTTGGGGSGLMVSRRRGKNASHHHHLDDPHLQHLHHLQRRMSDTSLPVPSSAIPRSHSANAIPTIEGLGGGSSTTPLNSNAGGQGYTYPLLQKALAHARPVLSREVYDALEATATDALSLTELGPARHRDIGGGMGGSGSEYGSGSLSPRILVDGYENHQRRGSGRGGRPGPTSHPPSMMTVTTLGSSVGGTGGGTGTTGGMSERALRRKADNLCRSLTELCIALAGEAAGGGGGGGVGGVDGGGVATDGMMPGYHAVAMGVSNGVTSRALIRAEARKAAAAAAGDMTK